MVVQILRVVDWLASKFGVETAIASLEETWNNIQTVASSLLQAAAQLLDSPLETTSQQTFLYHQQALDDSCLQVFPFWPSNFGRVIYVSCRYAR
jgi:hypothetical protein